MTEVKVKVMKKKQKKKWSEVESDFQGLKVNPFNIIGELKCNFEKIITALIYKQLGA